ncbi:SDR family oxidoreductase [Marinobacterium lutimaris]|uniref:Nucleoside-diphosphate-sugar epimerase n=1 Tax=Marinobacterium lutimaris TaxID=568106 RepID=A0A1H6D113_9GAMM|nr:SDR family oxidoreductase [Marinobacterium lutimaris]SEG79051.1 Nucleoside-diphosphate-sugar epimerase [Marinobacterium lutimaris]
MQKIRVLIAGCGDVGSALGVSLAAEGVEVYGLRRTINQLPEAIQPLAGDLSSADGLPALPACDYLVYAAAAKSRDLEVYRSVYVDGLKRVLAALPQPPKRLFLTSSTGVYGQHEHEWVDEFSATEPDSPSGQILLESEQIALSASVPATVVRFSGIYGPGRTHLLNQVRAGIQAPESPVHFSNRIHRDDCAGFLAHLVGMAIRGETLAPIYLTSDNAPTPISEVMGWLAQQLDVEITERKPVRRGGSKRCRNLRLQATGYKLKYPDFKTGFSELLKEPK